MWYVHIFMTSVALMTSQGAPLTELQSHGPIHSAIRDLQSAPQEVDPFDPLENLGVKLDTGVLIEGDIRYVEDKTPSLGQRQMSKAGFAMDTSFINTHQARHSVDATERVWPNKIIPYELDYALNETELHNINAAMNTIMDTACVEFVARSTETNFLYITNRRRGCWSDIGMKGGNQTVSVSRASGCVTSGIVMHELMHALGFWHEHTRTDRDKYITVLRKNIMFNRQGEFFINPKGKILVPEYDYYSILHYKTTTFSKDNRRLKTIRILRKDINENWVGQRQYLSKYDRQRIKALYGCDKSRKDMPEKIPKKNSTNIITARKMFAPVLPFISRSISQYKQLLPSSSSRGLHNEHLNAGFGSRY